MTAKKYRSLVPGEQPPASQGTVDGKYRLACGIFCQAIKDLHSIQFPLRALDAALWLADGEGYQLAEDLGYFIQPGELLYRAAQVEV
jgi:hypothetical protein